MATGGSLNPSEESMSVFEIPAMTKKAFVHADHIIRKPWCTLLENGAETNQ